MRNKKTANARTVSRAMAALLRDDHCSVGYGAGRADVGLKSMCPDSVQNSGWRCKDITIVLRDMVLGGHMRN